MTDGFALKSWVINLINKVSKKNNKYSTDETVIGTWIDGKPLYRKVFKETNLPQSQWYHIDISTMDIDTVSAFYGIFYGIGFDGEKNTPFDYPIGIESDSPNKATAFVQRFENRKPWQICIAPTTCSRCLITIEYTKTADKATIKV